MGGFGSLYVGVSGLQTSQNALNTTAHNLANVETKGFVRQQVMQGNLMYVSIGNAACAPMQVGLGVQVEDIKQFRDYFYDREYRKESGRAGYYEGVATSYDEVLDYFQELDGATYQELLDDINTSISELAKSPDAVNKKQFLLTASNFLDRSTIIYEQMMEYQDNLNMQVKDTVDEINGIGKEIAALNEAIGKVELGGVEQANDLRDQRNLALDKLSALADITYEEDKDGFVNVKLEGKNFVREDKCYQMGVIQDEVTDFYTPVWPMEGNNEVFNTKQKISADLNTDIGKLKALVFSRGDKRANYTDMADKDHFNNEIAYSSIMTTMAEFDQLVHGIVTMMNEVICGDPAHSADGEKPIELFVRQGTPDRYTDTPDADGYYVRIEEDPNDPSTLYSCANLIINPKIKEEISNLDFETADGPDREKADKLLEMWNADFSSLNPNIEGKVNFKDYYTNLIGEVSNGAYVYASLARNQQLTAAGVDNKRQQVIGVSSDEELTNLIKYQNAYNASSRYINVVSEMLEHLITTLGR